MQTTGRIEWGKTYDFYRKVSPDFVGVAALTGLVSFETDAALKEVFCCYERM